MFLLLQYSFFFGACAQNKTNDVTTPLHLLKPDYPIPYGAPTIDNVTEVLNKVYNYLDTVTPALIGSGSMYPDILKEHIQKM